MGTETYGNDARPELAIIDRAHAQSVELRDLTDSALLAETHLADMDLRTEAGRLDDLRTKIEGIRSAHGPGAADQLLTEELRQAQRVRLASLRLTEAQVERQRRQEAAQAAQAQAAQVERAQRLAELRAQAWQQYVRDAGHRLDGVSLADESAFNARWAEYLVDLALGRVTLPA